MLRRTFGIGLACLFVAWSGDHATTAWDHAAAAADEAADEQKAIDAIQKAGGKVETDADEPGKPAVGVDLGGDKVTDAELAPLESLTRLRRLYLGGAHIT